MSANRRMTIADVSQIALRLLLAGGSGYSTVNITTSVYDPEVLNFTVGGTPPSRAPVRSLSLPDPTDKTTFQVWMDRFLATPEHVETILRRARPELFEPVPVENTTQRKILQVIDAATSHLRDCLQELEELRKRAEIE